MKTNLLLADFREKAELFNSLFANQCSLIKKTSVLQVLPTDCESLANKSLPNITFTDNDIEKIIKWLDLSKAHAHDMISIRMLKLFGGSIYKLLRLIFRTCLDQRTFPLCYKKNNVVPIHKKVTNSQ